MFEFRVTMRRKHNAPEEKKTNSEDKDPLGLGIVEKRVLMPPISPAKRNTIPDSYQNNKGSLKTFSSVTDLDKIKFGLDEDPPGNISFLTPS